MASFNKIILAGNLTRDPELRYTPKGSAVCELGLAVNRQWKDDDGEKHEEVTFVDVVLWNKLAELAEKYLVKGRNVLVEGRLQMESWEDKQTGQKRTRLRVVGEQMQFLGVPPDRESEGDAEGSPAARPGHPSAASGGGAGRSQRPGRLQQGQGQGYGGAASRNAAPQRTEKPGEGDYTVPGDEDDDIPF